MFETRTARPVWGSLFRASIGTQVSAPLPTVALPALRPPVLPFLLSGQNPTYQPIVRQTGLSTYNSVLLGFRTVADNLNWKEGWVKNHLFHPVRYHREVTVRDVFSYYSTGWHDEHSQLKCSCHATHSNTWTSLSSSKEQQSGHLAITGATCRNRHCAARRGQVFKPFKLAIPRSGIQLLWFEWWTLSFTSST